MRLAMLVSHEHGKEGNKGPALAPPMFALVAASLCLVLRPDLVGIDPNMVEEGDQTPQSISQVTRSEIEQTLAKSRALRGCCGAPVEFRWIFPDGEARAGKMPFVTRLAAFDAVGRPANAALCAALRVNVSISGRGRLSTATSQLSWRGPELQLEIEDEVAEEVSAEVRIESTAVASDALLHTSRIHFRPGKEVRYYLRLQPIGLSDGPHVGVSANGGEGGGTWPTRVVFDCVLLARDEFRNRVAVTSEAVSRLQLRADSPALKIKSVLQVDTHTGEAHAQVLCDQPALVRFWLERDGITFNDGIALRVDFVGAVSAGPADWTAPGRQLSAADERWRPEAERVREAFLHAWGGYKRHAWGCDELLPLAGKGKESFGHVGMTILDSLTTIWLMGLPKEFDEAAKFVQEDLSFDRADMDISVFEMFIRGLGGLVSAHAFSGREIFLKKAVDLADRLLPALNSSSRLPYPKWNLARGSGPKSTEATILAEAGSMQLELRALSAATGDLKYRRAGDATFDAVQSAGITGLMPVSLSPPDVTPVVSLADKVEVGALADSYYEYLLKQWLQSPSEVRFKELWIKVMEELPLLQRPKGIRAPGTNTKIRLIEASPSGAVKWKTDHLSCFAPGMIALGLATLPSADLATDGRGQAWRGQAEGLTAGCVDLWTSTASGLSAEYVPVEPKKPHNVGEAPNGGRHSFLRPETAESLYYLHRLTGEERYREMGRSLFRAIEAHAKVERGYATVKDVYKVPVEHVDEMHTFVLAETFKYLFLLFSPADALDLGRFVLNTEGHPLPRLGPRTEADRNF